jgi:hypothetical protein
MAYVDVLVPRQVCKEVVSEYSLKSNTVPDYNSDSSYEFNFGFDPIEPESEFNTTEELLSGPTAGLVIMSTLAVRFVYWLDHKPTNVTDDNSHCVV